MMSTDEYLALNYGRTLSLDEDGSYIIEVDDLPGCIADGETPLTKLMRIASKRCDLGSSRGGRLDYQIPEPRVRDEYSGKFVVQMAKSLHKRLAIQAEQENISLNQYVVTLLTDASSNGIAAAQGAANEGYFISALHPNGMVRSPISCLETHAPMWVLGRLAGHETYLGNIVNQERTQDMNTPA